MSTGEIRTLGAPDFSSQIEPLLKEANVKSTPNVRSSLVSTLNLVWATVQLERSAKKQRIPPRLFNSLRDSIKNTQRLLRRLEKFQLPDIDNDEWPVLNGKAIKPGKKVDVVPAGATMVAFSRQQMLDRLLREIARYNPKRRRGHQDERDKSLIVAYAGDFFSAIRP